MTLRINGVDVEIVDAEFRNPPSLVEERDDIFEFRAGDSEAELLVDGIPLPRRERDYRDPAVVRWTWEKGPRGRVGFVECNLRLDGVLVGGGLLKIEPRKLTLDQYIEMVDEIAEIAYSVVYDLRDTTFEYLDLVEPNLVPKSGIEWLETITGFLSSLEDALDGINKQPHVKLNTREVDRFIWEIEHPGPSALSRVASAEGADLVPDHSSLMPSLSQPLRGLLPLGLPEAIHEIDTNTYENQLVAQFLDSVIARIRLIRIRAAIAREWDLAGALIPRLESLRSLPFLTDVSELRQPPRPTLVLLNNFRYRRFYEIFRRFHWGLRIRYSDNEAADLFRLTTRHVHKSYEVWTFFKVVEAARIALGGQAIAAEGVIDVLDFDELLISLKDGGRIMLETARGDHLSISYQRYFGTASQPYSVSLPKVPDIIVQAEGAAEAVAFDAKYRLDSEDPEEPALGPSGPKPEDIDKMHVYRDAVRVGADRRYFLSAAYVVYPGTTLQLFDDNRLGAIPLRPGDPLDSLVGIIRRGIEGITV